MKCTEKCSKTRGFMKLLLTIGGLNWGLVGIGGLFDLGNWNVVNIILGSVSWLENIVYLLVGLSALILLKSCGGKCNKGSHEPKAESSMDHGHNEHH